MAELHIPVCISDCPGLSYTYLFVFQIALGTVTNVDEAVKWLSYMYLFVFQIVLGLATCTCLYFRLPWAKLHVPVCILDCPGLSYTYLIVFQIALGTVTNVDEAVKWLSYTYLFVRMKCNPLVYGINYNMMEVSQAFLQKKGFHF